MTDQAPRRTRTLAPDVAGIAEAAACLKSGGLVAMPTETVYGLAADATSDRAVASIYAAKTRPTFNPLIAHVLDHAAAAREALFDAHAERLAEAFWPGPLTLVAPAAPGCRISALARAGLDSVALRAPSHPAARALIETAGLPLAAPSANRFGRLSPTKPEHVREELGGAVEVILDGGESPIGLESTIVSCLNDEARLLRPGFITRSQLEHEVGPLATGGAVPRVPGDRRLHYAPNTPLAIVASDDLERYAAEFVARQEKVAVLAMRLPLQTQRYMTWINAGKKPAAYAHNLYNHLRTLDSAGCARILVQALPDDENWAAIHDRLRRASGVEDGDPLELSAG